MPRYYYWRVDAGTESQEKRFLCFATPDIMPEEAQLLLETLRLDHRAMNTAGRPIALDMGNEDGLTPPEIVGVQSEWAAREEALQTCRDNIEVLSARPETNPEYFIAFRNEREVLPVYAAAQEHLRTILGQRPDSNSPSPPNVDEKPAGTVVATPPAVETSAGEGEGGDAEGVPTDIESLEKATPQLDKKSGQWVSNKVAAENESLETRTLADYRLKGIKNSDGTLGRDSNGRIWRRVGTPGAHPWYLRSTLRVK